MPKMTLTDEEIVLIRERRNEEALRRQGYLEGVTKCYQAINGLADGLITPIEAFSAVRDIFNEAAK